LTAVFQSLAAQNICSEAVVYFDSGKAELTQASRDRLDSLLSQWSRREVLLELEGHTDSVNNVQYNHVLSQRRVAAVKHYLKNHGTARLTVREFARSETKPIANNGTETGKALNRRVTIKYASLENGSLTAGAAKGAEVSFAPDGLGDCSVCASIIKAKYYANDQQIAASGWGMVTTTGQQLTSGGMMSFSTGCRDKKAKEPPFPACFEFPVTSKEPEFKGWVTNAAGVWEEVPMTIEGDKAKICIPDYYWGRGVNYDCPIVNQYVFADSSNLKLIRSSLVYNTPRQGPTTYLPNEVYAESDLAKAVYSSVAVDDQEVLWVCNSLVTPMIDPSLKQAQCTRRYPYTARLVHYRPVIFSDTLQQIKVSRKSEIVSMEYYLRDADTAFAFQQVDKRKFEAPILLYGHQIKFTAANGKTWMKTPKSIRLRYKAKVGKMVGRLRK
jgi:hypothetical protein